MDKMDLPQLANRIRQHVVNMVYKAKSGHMGGALGITDVLTYLYFKELKIDPKRGDWSERDRFVLSPGHVVPGLYAVLAERGFFPVAELDTLRANNSRLKGHTFRNLDIGVETTGGSLGQGFSLALGMAMNAKIKDLDYRTYCIISDGELNEGQIWEGLMFGYKHELDNLCVILDRNHIQLSDQTEIIMPTEPIVDKLKAFNWQVLEIDGHDFGQIGFALSKSKIIKGRPTIIIANVTAGRGVSFMENNSAWHGKAPNDVEFKLAIQELKIYE